MIDMFKYDTFWPRVGALLLDGIIFSLLRFLVGYLLVQTSITLIKFVQFIMLILPYVYSIVLIRRYGQTVGKFLLNIKVLDNKTEQNLNFVQSFLREAIPFIIVIFNYVITLTVNGETNILTFISDNMLTIWVLIEIVTMLFNSKKRALHDIIAGSVVVRA